MQKNIINTVKYYPNGDVFVFDNLGICRRYPAIQREVERAKPMLDNVEYDLPSLKKTIR